jgi:hypothetical protein
MEFTTKQLAVGVLALVVFCAGAGALGGMLGSRHAGVQIVEKTTHHETETRLQTIEQKVDMTVLQKLVQEQFAKLQKNIRVETTTEKRPDGSEVTHTVATDNSTAESGSKSTTDTSTKLATDTKTKLLDEKLVVDEKVVTAIATRQSWAAGVFATYQPLFAPPGFNLLPEQRLTVGITADYRLFGPFWGGGILTSTLAVGLHLQAVW